jgi:hypothetical protein
VLDGESIDDTFSSLVKTGSREPAIAGEKRKKDAFKLRKKHPSKSSSTRLYRTLIGRVDSSIRQTMIKRSTRLCNKGKFGRLRVREDGSPGRGQWSRAMGRHGGGGGDIKRVCEKAPCQREGTESMLQAVSRRGGAAGRGARDVRRPNALEPWAECED